jgi:ssRNA-specific RNase YbeY (16S rRNA maturation enzyme)
VTKQELMDALLAEAVLKLNGGGDIVSVEKAVAAAEKAGNVEEWREAVQQIVKNALNAETKPSDSEIILMRATADAKALKEQYLNDPYRSPAKCNVTSYWYYKPKTKEMTVPSHEGDVIAPVDFKQRFSQARQSAVGRGEGFIVGFLEENAPQGSGQITVRLWDAAFSSRFAEPVHVSKPQRFAVDSHTDEITWTEVAE